MAQKPPAPIVGRQDFQRLIHEHTAPARGGELPAVIVQVVERLDKIDKFPRLLAAQNCGGEAERVEGHVIFAHELRVLDVIGAFIGAPPAGPVVPFACIDPFLGAGDVFDGRVKPDVENLPIHARPVLFAVFDGDAPVEIAGDAAVLQAITVIEPFLRNRCRQHRPVGLAVDPCRQVALQL